MRFLYAVRTSATKYPLFAFYVAGVAVLILTFKNLVSLGQAIIILGIAGLLILWVVEWLETMRLHRMVDGQRTEMIKQIDRLAGMLVAAGIKPPIEDPHIKQARNESADA